VGLEEIFAPVDEALKELAPGLAFKSPDRALDIGKPPRISWDPTEAVHSSATRITGAAGDDGPFSTRQWAIKVEVWGEDLGETEILVDLFLATARRLLSKHSFQPGPEKWDTGGVSGKGALCTMAVFINRPVLKIPQPYRRITEVDVVSTMGDAGSATDNITGS
jgi:hypothetical protein